MTNASGAITGARFGPSSMRPLWRTVSTTGADWTSEGEADSRHWLHSNQMAVTPRSRFTFRRTHFDAMTLNYRAALDAATALCLHIGRQGRGASERGRWPK